MILDLKDNCLHYYLLEPQIFGATSHLGRSLVRAVTGHGDKVTAVGWSQEDDLNELTSWQNNKSIGLLCDVRVSETVESVITQSVNHWGRVDVIAKYVPTLLQQDQC
jgi:NAD(P)-dependent dehydrogenase (short-subunit alcohol dehydrogenase family)